MLVLLSSCTHALALVAFLVLFVLLAPEFVASGLVCLGGALPPPPPAVVRLPSCLPLFPVLIAVLCLLMIPVHHQNESVQH